MPFKYPEQIPYEQAHLDVGDGHQIYYEQSGNCDGLPVVFLHGGPGGGLHPGMRRFFDPARYRIILFDQRGCGKSKPHAELSANSIDHLIEDIEKLRRYLGIEKWIVTGASWGSALAMLYAGQYADHVSSLILSGIFFADDEGRDFLAEEGGVSRYRPDLFNSYRDFIPIYKRSRGLAKAYYEILIHGDYETQMEATRRFILYDTPLLRKVVTKEDIAEICNNPAKFYPLCRIYFHFAVNEYCKRNRARIIEAAGKLAALKIPCAIFHGEKDMVCPVEYARLLHASYPGSLLYILPHTYHGMREDLSIEVITQYTDALEWVKT